MSHKNWPIGAQLRALVDYKGWFDTGDILTYHGPSGNDFVRVSNNDDKYILTRSTGNRDPIGGFYPHSFELISNEGNTNTMNNDNIIRLLSTVAVINSATFAKQTPVKQTEVLTLAAGKTVLFVENFNTLSNTKRIAERLFAGEDVSMELEFNNIEISDDERKAIDAVRPVLEKLNALKGSDYEFLSDDKLNEAKRNLTLRDNSITRRGYTITRLQAVGLWKKYAPWVMGGDKPKQHSGRFDGYSRAVTYNDDYSITIGCQANISRAEIECIAKHFNFDTSIS